MSAKRKAERERERERERGGVFVLNYFFEIFFLETSRDLSRGKSARFSEQPLDFPRLRVYAYTRVPVERAARALA